MILESRAQKLMKEMNEQGRLKTISQKGSYRIDHKFAMGLKPIKDNFYHKTKNSIRYINNLELKTATV